VSRRDLQLSPFLQRQVDLPTLTDSSAVLPRWIALALDYHQGAIWQPQVFLPGFLDPLCFLSPSVRMKTAVDANSWLGVERTGFLLGQTGLPTMATARTASALFKGDVL